jgi:hypothetical protein
VVRQLSACVLFLQGPLVEELGDTLQQLRVEAADARRQQQQVSRVGGSSSAQFLGCLMLVASSLWD